MKNIRKVFNFGYLLFIGFMFFQSSVSLSAESEVYLKDEYTINDSSSSSNTLVKTVGTEFTAKGEYLNINLTSGESISCILESVPKIVSFIVESKSSANVTTITITGFEPSKTYYRYQDGELVESFTVDSNGIYSYQQDISHKHHISILEEKLTLTSVLMALLTRQQHR